MNIYLYIYIFMGAGLLFLLAKWMILERNNDKQREDIARHIKDLKLLKNTRKKLQERSNRFKPTLRV